MMLLIDPPEKAVLRRCLLKGELMASIREVEQVAGFWLLRVAVSRMGVAAAETELSRVLGRLPLLWVLCSPAELFLLIELEGLSV